MASSEYPRRLKRTRWGFSAPILSISASRRRSHTHTAVLAEFLGAPAKRGGWIIKKGQGLDAAGCLQGWVPSIAAVIKSFINCNDCCRRNFPNADKCAPPPQLLFQPKWLSVLCQCRLSCLPRPTPPFGFPGFTVVLSFHFLFCFFLPPVCTFFHLRSAVFVWCYLICII